MSKQFKEFDPITSLDGTEIVALQRIDGSTDPVKYMDAATFSGPEKNRLVGISTQGGASYTLAIADVGKLVKMLNISANTLTVPPNSSVPFTLYSVIHIVQGNTGQTTLVEGTGVTIFKTDTLNTRAQNSWLSIVKVATDQWHLTGDVELL